MRPTPPEPGASRSVGRLRGLGSRGHLLRRATRVRERAIDTAVALPSLQPRLATRALRLNLAGILRHPLPPCVRAKRAGQRRNVPHLQATHARAAPSIYPFPANPVPHKRAPLRVTRATQRYRTKQPQSPEPPGAAHRQRTHAPTPPPPVRTPAGPVAPPLNPPPVQQSRRYAYMAPGGGRRRWHP